MEIVTIRASEVLRELKGTVDMLLKRLQNHGIDNSVYGNDAAIAGCGLYGVVPGTAGEAVGKQDWEMAEAGMDNDLSTFYRTLDLKTN